MRIWFKIYFLGLEAKSKNSGFGDNMVLECWSIGVLECWNAEIMENPDSF